MAEGKVQRFKCQECGYYFTGVERYHYLPPDKVALIHRMYEEKGEMRKIARVLGITLKAVQYHLKKKDERNDSVLS